MPLRAIFDTNIRIAREVKPRGTSARCVQAAKAGEVRLAYCREMTAELSEKLRFEFGYPENHIHSVLYDLKSISQRVEITGDLYVVEDDPDDDKFVECAQVWEAEYIVSATSLVRGAEIDGR